MSGSSERHPEHGARAAPTERERRGPASDGAPTVFVVDDDAGVRGLFESIGATLELRTRTFATAESFLDAYEPAMSGCLVVDLQLPSMSGLELLAEVRRRGWSIPMIAISGAAELADAVGAFRAGSMDFLEKPFDVASMATALRRAIDRDREQRIAAIEVAAISSRIAELTPRELQVMKGVCAGLSNKGVASELGLSPKTVEVHRANVMQKMQASSLAELVRLVVLAEGGTPRASTCP